MTPTTEQLQVLIDVYSAALKSEFAYRNQELSRMQTASILAKAELSRREVSNPHITARETIELANYMVAQSAEIERLKALHNPELVPAAAHMILTQRDEIERLKGLLTIYFNAQQETP